MSCKRNNCSYHRNHGFIHTYTYIHTFAVSHGSNLNDKVSDEEFVLTWPNGCQLFNAMWGYFWTFSKFWILNLMILQSPYTHVLSLNCWCTVYFNIWITGMGIQAFKRLVSYAWLKYLRWYRSIWTLVSDIQTYSQML